MSAEFDFDQILNLEEGFYQQGFDEGQSESTKKQYIEGKEFGYQTAYQRFIIIGYVKGLLKTIPQTHASLCSSNKALSLTLLQLTKLVGEVRPDNSDVSVAIFETNIVKIRNKCRVLNGLLKHQGDLVKEIDALVGEISGQIKTSESADNMW
ncbi:hypothetical protein BABINDRAFT_35836 [Babjeviella inositovora NRRL Y-12698]|uniref:Essential protein Yae1 N-terminal domain-containing protein n=1 Tax=Babjeviella inositovora NRRL Y-12698 TaxID=984486 RepID=A0A1E3QRM9_9ASCO|nr:uncharacterized protein BABINDRAFT_35836 [Babjeviella inositovora NRRL Y-12698]ODQ80366.1 hypothetical protein BABINDRAFT_35836 [Babjeviella inositovora NRRL Y-12698]